MLVELFHLYRRCGGRLVLTSSGWSVVRQIGKRYAIVRWNPRSENYVVELAPFGLFYVCPLASDVEGVLNAFFATEIARAAHVGMN
jgi:hypothetical protein